MNFFSSSSSSGTSKVLDFLPYFVWGSDSHSNHIRAEARKIQKLFLELIRDLASITVLVYAFTGSVTFFAALRIWGWYLPIACGILARIAIYFRDE